jgi:hypothetical protein
MRGLVLAAAVLAVLSAGPAKAGDDPDGQAAIRGCITAAAEVYRLPPAVLVILLNVEGGALGRVSPNTNGTVDIGPIQVNQIWLPDVAAHWNATIADAYKALRDSFCANVEAGAWILRRGLDEAHGDFWQGVGYYHSHTPEHKTRYLREVLRQVLRLRALVERADTSARPNVAQATAPPLAPSR